MYKLLLQCRRFSTSVVVFHKRTTREARIMNKLIGVSSKKRSWYLAKDVSATSLPHIVQTKRGERNTRRMSILNKLFMKYVTDLLATGEVAPEITNLGIEITKVKISQDFSVLKVYWVAKGNNTDEGLENVLPNYAWKLRHELTQLRVIGNVPAVLFVRDKSVNKVADVNAILTKADFGDDFVPTDPSFLLLSDLKLSTKLPPHLEEKVLSQDDGLPEMPIPSMQSNALGLEHEAIMQKIRLSMNKAKAPHRRLEFIHSSNEESDSDEERSLTSAKFEESFEGHETGINLQSSDLRKFFAKRVAMQSKYRKASKNYDPSEEILLTQEDSLVDEDFDDIDILADAHRIKELEIHVDDFEGIEDYIKSQLNEDEILK